MVVALAHLHGLGIDHRDVKPANMLVCVGVGGYMQAVLHLLDFATASKLPRANATRLTAQKHTFRRGRLYEPSSLLRTHIRHDRARARWLV